MLLINTSDYISIMTIAGALKLAVKQKTPGEFRKYFLDKLREFSLTKSTQIYGQTFNTPDGSHRLNRYLHFLPPEFGVSGVVHQRGEKVFYLVGERSHFFLIDNSVIVNVLDPCSHNLSDIPRSSRYVALSPEPEVITIFINLYVQGINGYLNKIGQNRQKFLENFDSGNAFDIAAYVAALQEYTYANLGLNDAPFNIELRCAAVVFSQYPKLSLLDVLAHLTSYEKSEVLSKFGIVDERQILEMEDTCIKMICLKMCRSALGEDYPPLHRILVKEQVGVLEQRIIGLQTTKQAASF